MYYKKYMPGLDIIRAAALLSVLLFHLFPRAFPGGFLGVETFFVLTGFLLAINDGPERRENILHFYGRKLRRLYPPLLLVLLLTCGLMALFLPAALYGLRGETLSVLLGFSAVSLALLMPAAYLLTGSVSFVYYSTPTRAFSLFLGVLAGLSYRSGNPIGKFFMRIMKTSAPIRGLFIAGNTLFAAFLLLRVSGADDILYLGGMAAVSVWAAYLILTAAEMKGPVPKGAKLLSALSFEIYLWQYPVNFLFTGMFGNYISIKLAELPVILALALWTHYLTKIEVKKYLWKTKNTLLSERKRKEGRPAGSEGCC